MASAPAPAGSTRWSLFPGHPLLLPELCHGCGVCTYACPEVAIAQGSREIGGVGAGFV